MTRESFISHAKPNRIPADAYCFDDLLGRDDVYWVREAHGVWEIGYIERGKESDYHRFSSEFEALDFLFNSRLSRYQKK